MAYKFKTKIMKRELEFRVWDKYKKLYLPKDVYCILNRTEFGAFGKMIKDWEDYREGEFFYDDSQVLEEYTGIDDKNKVKIWEGDKVRWWFGKHYWEAVIQSTQDNKSTNLYAIETFNNVSINEGGEYTFLRNDSRRGSRNDIEFLSTNIEVICNIHDN